MSHQYQYAQPISKADYWMFGLSVCVALLIWLGVAYYTNPIRPWLLKSHAKKICKLRWYVEEVKYLGSGFAELHLHATDGTRRHLVVEISPRHPSLAELALLVRLEQITFELAEHPHDSKASLGQVIGDYLLLRRQG